MAPAATSSSTAPRLRLCTDQLMSRLHQVSGHGFTHDAKSNESNVFCHDDSFPGCGSALPPSSSSSEPAGLAHRSSPCARGYNPNARLHYEASHHRGGTARPGGAPLWRAAGTPSRGAYVEARTAEVFTGGCIMNSEAETVGKQAVLAWKVDRGSFNGIDIDGLSVVAALSGDREPGHDRNGRREAGRPLPRCSSTSAPTRRSSWRSWRWPTSCRTGWSARSSR